MASDIRIETGFLDHPKTVMLQRRLGPTAAEYVLRLWLWASDNRPDGDLSGLSEEHIEIACHWEGEPGKLVPAMREVRYLDGEDGALAIHDWAEHQPWVVNRGKRHDAAKEAANARWEKKRNATGKRELSGSDTGGNADSMRGGCAAHAEGNALTHESAMPPTQPNPTQPNLKPKTLKPKAQAEPLALPDWLPKDAWDGFVEMRKRIKAPLTDRAIGLCIGELEKLRAQGNDVGAVLNQSVVNGWKGVFPLHPPKPMTRAPTPGIFTGTDYTAGTRGKNPDGSYKF